MNDLSSPFNGAFNFIRTPMKISKIHQEFSEQLNDPRALTHPEDFLGPNWKDLINFWLHVDGLSEEEKRKMNDRFWALDEDVLKSASDAKNAAKKVVGKKVINAIWLANVWNVFNAATRELITRHKLLEQGKTLVALPLCLKS